MRVLFVDDEADLWSIRLRGRLKTHGLELITEQDADHALSRILTEQPDVVLLDVMFPNHDGRVEAKGRAIGALIAKRFPSIPVVMFTSTLVDASHSIDERDFPDACFLFSKDRFADKSGADPYEEL